MRIFFSGKNAAQGLKESDPTSLISLAEKHEVTISETLTSQDDLLVCVDFETAILKLVRRAKRLGVRTCLIINEPSVVIPQHAQSRILKKFDKVIFVGRPYREPMLKWPQTWTPLRITGSRIDRAVIVNADKWSFVRGQHYWLRAAISNQDSRVDIYGPGWSRSGLERALHRVFEFVRTLFSLTRPSFQGLKYVLANPKNYLGMAEDKVETMSRYKVAVVIENSSELMTEKLFDAWFAGCVPVFVGPLVKQIGIPQDLVVETAPDVNSLRTAIQVALEVDIHDFHVRLADFLRSKEALEWKAELAIAEVLAEATTTNSAS